MATLVSDTQTAITADAATGSATTLYETMYFMVDVTTATAGTLDIEVEWSQDGTTWTSFSTPDAFATITTTIGQTWLGPVPGRMPFFRLNYTVVTGPYTFSVVGVGF
jgi:hypothetical protein